MFYAIIFSLMCFLFASLGASIIFFVKNINKNMEAILNGFASGVMMASCIFSLIIPAISYCDELNMSKLIILPICFIIGGIMFVILDIITSKKNTTNINTPMLVFGIGLHNIPEGMCVGLAFASASIINTQPALMSAIMIALGIAIQNIPEGSSVSFPLYSSGMNKKKSFFYSALVQFVEVPSAIIAYLIGTHFISIFPFMLSFSSALVMLVVMCDIFPESLSKNKRLALISMLVGFIIMMVLDLALA